MVIGTATVIVTGNQLREIILYGHNTRPKNVLLSMSWSLQKGFQVTPQVEMQILKKVLAGICFDNKMASNGSKGFILTTKLYKIPKDAPLLVNNKQNLEGKAATETEGMEAQKNDNQITIDTKNSCKWAPHIAWPYRRIQDARNHKVPALHHEGDAKVLQRLCYSK